MTRRRTIAPCSRALSSKSACSSNRPSTPFQVHPPGKSVADMDSLNQSAADLPMQKLAPMEGCPGSPPSSIGTTIDGHGSPHSRIHCDVQGEGVSRMSSRHLDPDGPFTNL